MVGEFIDDGVSATHNKPEHRPGWRSLLGAPVPFDAVIDFLHADETLQARGAAIVCVEQSIDMTTAEGRAFAQMLAVFGEMEAAAISSRITTARAHLISQGRIPGGLQPYGWCSVPNPDGPGYVRGQEPERIEWVRGMVERVLMGDTVYSIQTWLSTAGAPAPRARQPGRRWGYSSVDVLMRNPVLAGMFPINSRNAYGPEGPDVRRGEDGQPIVAADGIITAEQYRSRTSHFPDPSPASLRHRYERPVDTEGSHVREIPRRLAEWVASAEGRPRTPSSRAPTGPASAPSTTLRHPSRPGQVPSNRASTKPGAIQRSQDADR